MSLVADFAAMGDFFFSSSPQDNIISPISTGNRKLGRNAVIFSLNSDVLRNLMEYGRRSKVGVKWKCNG